MCQQIKKRNDLTTLKYVQPASPMSQEQGGLVTTTVKDYDLQEVAKALKGILMVSSLSHLNALAGAPKSIQY